MVAPVADGMPAVWPRLQWTAPVLVACVAALAIAGAYGLGHPWLHWLSKPAATLLITAMAWRSPSSESVYQRAVIGGLLLSTLGDVFLMLPGDWFVFGLGSFLLAHLAYLGALTRRERLMARRWPVVLYGLVAGGVLAFLWPSLPEALRLPVLAYVIVLAGMAAQAAAVWLLRRDSATSAAAVGGAFFVVSDATLAIDRFALPFAAASALVLATYWIAQTGIALSVATSPRSVQPR